MEGLAYLAQGGTLARRIRDVLKDRILNGEILPGTRLRDNELAASFHASNTPVREALRLLAQDGLVEIVPYRGCVVRSVDATELAEMLDLRTALEAHAARLAARRLGDRELQELEATVEAYEQACADGDWEQASDADHSFHRFLAEATGNRMLVRGLQQIEDRIYLARRTHLRKPLANSRISCRAILEALQARDGERAAALLAEHIACGQARACENGM